MRFPFGSKSGVNRPEGHEDIGIKFEVHYIPCGHPGYLEISYNANGKVINSVAVYVDSKQYQGDIEKGLVTLGFGEHQIEVVLIDSAGKRFTKREKIQV